MLLLLALTREISDPGGDVISRTFERMEVQYLFSGHDQSALMSTAAMLGLKWNESDPLQVHYLAHLFSDHREIEFSDHRVAFSEKLVNRC